MFEQSLVESTHKVGTRKPMTMLLSFSIQIIVIAIVAIIPLIYYNVLPATQLMSFLAVPPPPPPPPPPPAVVPKIVVHKFVSEVTQTGALVAPKVIPKNIAMISESAPPPPVSVNGGGTDASGLINDMLASAPKAAPPPPPPPPQKINIGGDVEAAKCINCNSVLPQYPAIARQARIQGDVVLKATISKEGTIENLQVVSGSPMLVGAAEQAVRQWRYQPTILDGNVPVEVDTIITVKFNLGG